MFNKSMLPLVAIFLVVGGLVLGFKDRLATAGMDWQVVSGGNLFLYLVTSLSFSMLREGMKAANTHAFLTRAYGGILVKLFGCAIAAFIYILMAGDKLNKPALFACMGLYLVYSFVELRIVLKNSNRQKNVHP